MRGASRRLRRRGGGDGAGQVAAFGDEQFDDAADRILADMVDQIVQHRRVEDRRLAHDGRNLLPVPVSCSRGRCTDFVGSAIAWPITEARRPWRARIASVRSASPGATTTQKPMPML